MYRMSKRKDRLYTEYRCCPICRGRYIWIEKTKKLFHKEKTYIYCGDCNKYIEVEVQNEQ